MMQSVKAADTIQLSLQISWTTLNCYWATGIDLWSITVSKTEQTISGNAWIGNTFECIDLRWDATWQYSMIGDNTPIGSFQNTTYGNIIPRSGIVISITNPAHITQGNCSIANDSTGNLQDGIILMKKTGNVDQICDVVVNSTGVTMAIDVPAYTKPWTYKGTIIFTQST